MKINELMLMDNVELLYEYPVVLFGAGSCGSDIAEILEEAEMQFDGFADSDILKWGTEKNNRPIYSPFQLKEKCQKEKVIVIISVGTRRVDSVLAVMEHLEINPYLTSTTYAIEYAIYAHPNCERFPNSFAEKQALRHRVYLERSTIESRYNMQKTLSDCNLTLLNKRPILVYQPGKVGSRSVFSSLAKLKMPVAHLHYMTYGDQTTILNEVTATVRIITGVRSPISRLIASFFYFIRNGRTTLVGPAFDGLLKDGVMEALLKFPKRNIVKDEFEWYDSELKKYCNIDVYDYPFDKEKGYTIIEKGNIKVFLYKMECLDKLEAELRDFVGNPNLVMEHDNSINDTPGRYAYREFKEAVKIPADIFWEYYNSEKVRHFYTDEEMEEMRNAWIDRLV